jgi:hypothetical protein
LMYITYIYTQKHTTHKHASCPNKQMLAMIADPVLGRNHFKNSQRFPEGEEKESKEDDREEEEEEEEESGEEEEEEEEEEVEEEEEEEEEEENDDDDDNDEGWAHPQGPSTVPWYWEPGDW